MTIPPGTRLGPYEIVGPLGSGGMGDVYRARDTRLDRFVAVKTLKADLAPNPERRARFEREARTIAALTHPHICTLYDVGHATVPGTAEEVAFLVMELIEGTTLAERLTHGALALDEALEIARQVADALHRAHSDGIVHRDLKPANIMVTRPGSSRPGRPHVKLLDFGLARLRADRTVLADERTQTSGLSTDGVVLGTLQYIAPEQLEGREVDQRADLFAFGAILYEMVTGRRAFEATSTAGLISAILSSHPPRLSTVAPVAPYGLERIVSVCLAKSPDARWTSARDVRLLLDDTGEAHPANATSSARTAWREWLAWLVAGIAIAATIALALRAPPSEDRADRDVLSVVPPARTMLTIGEAPQVSPDGRTIAFIAGDEAGTTGLYVRDRGVADARLLPGTDDATQPFWSPDSRWLGFFAHARLKRIAISGGAAQTLAPAPVPRGGTWNRNDVIVFVPLPSQPPQQIPAAGGTPTTVPIADPSEGRWFPSFLPDGRHYLYLTTAPNRGGRAIGVASLDSTEIKDLVQTRASATYAEPGYLLFRREESLFAQPFDPLRLEVTGSPVNVADAIGFNPITYQTPFSTSGNGVLAYARSAPGWQLVWLDRLGRRLGVVGQPGGYNTLCLTPDGRQLFYDLADDRTGDVDIWSMDLNTGVRSRMTSDAAVDFFVVCSPTSPEVVFATLRTGVPQLFRGALTAPGGESQILKTPTPALPTNWSKDGRTIVYTLLSPKTGYDIWMLDASTGQSSPVVATDAEERSASLSPDGHWIAYTSDRSGGFEVWVQPIPPTGALWQVSTGGGRQPVWRPDGRELFYISSQQKLTAVAVTTTGRTLETGATRVVADIGVAGWERSTQGHPFLVTPDGERFLISSVIREVRPITVVLNWLAGLRTP